MQGHSVFPQRRTKPVGAGLAPPALRHAEPGNRVGAGLAPPACQALGEACLAPTNRALRRKLNDPGGEGAPEDSRLKRAWRPTNARGDVLLYARIGKT